MRIIKILKWSFILIFVFFLKLFLDISFIGTWRQNVFFDWIDREAIINYKLNKEEFQDLIDYAATFPAIEEIEFLKNKKFYSSFFYGNYLQDSLITYSLNSDGIIDIPFEFEIEDTTATITFPDTVIKTNYWSWEFIGNRDHEKFQTFIDLMGLSYEELATLRAKLKAIHCKRILMNPKKEIHIFFHGHSLCGFEYLITHDSSSVPENFIKLDSNIYYGYSAWAQCSWGF